MKQNGAVDVKTQRSQFNTAAGLVNVNKIKIVEYCSSGATAANQLISSK